MASILIAEDEDRIAAFVEKGLKSAGYATRIAGTGPEALDLALSEEFDLLVLDIGLPGMDGFEVLSSLRGQGSTMPVIVLTARGGGADTVAGLEGGADDYMAKPFRFDELLARIRLRMQTTQAKVADDALAHRGLELDVRTRRARVDGTEIDLSGREFMLAEELLRHAGQVLSREQLLSRVWGYDFDPGSNVVDVYVRYLRNKIGADRIETVRGMGYRMV